MTLTSDVLGHLIKQWEKLDDVAKQRRPLNHFLADHILQFSNLKSERTVIENRIDKEKREHAIRMQQLKDELLNFQSRCSHPQTKFHYDAAGGSDSYTECLLCGAEI